VRRARGERLFGFLKKKSSFDRRVVDDL